MFGVARLYFLFFVYVMYGFELGFYSLVSVRFGLVSVHDWFRFV